MNNTSKPLDAKGNSYSRIPLVLILLIGTFCTVLNQTILSTAFPTLMDTFNVNTSTVQWLTTGFMMVNGILIPVTAWLSSNFNTKWLYLGAMIIFEAGTILAAVAPNFGTIFAGRIIQAVGVGIAMPLLQTIMLSIFPKEKRGTAMGLAGIVIGLAPAIGPTLSGFIVDNYSWRVLFEMIIPIVALVIFFGLFFMKPVIKTTKTSLDYFSVILSTIGFGGILYGFSSVGNDGWGSATVITSLVIGVIFVVLFVARQFKMENPFLDLSVLKLREFRIATILSSTVFMAMVGVEMVLPLYLQIVRGMNAFHSGLTLLGGALMMGIMSPITGKLFDRNGAKRLSVAGLFLLSLGTLPFMFLTKDTPTLYITVLYGVRMFGISMVMMPVTTSGMNALPNRSMGHGTAVNNTARQIAASIATAVLVSILSNVTNSNMPGKSLLHSNPLAYKSAAINANLNGYTAAFGVALVFCVLALILAFFLKSNKKVKGDAK